MLFMMSLSVSVYMCDYYYYIALFSDHVKELKQFDLCKKENKYISITVKVVPLFCCGQPIISTFDAALVIVNLKAPFCELSIIFPFRIVNFNPDNVLDI